MTLRRAPPDGVPDADIWHGVRNATCKIAMALRAKFDRFLG